MVGPWSIAVKPTNALTNIAPAGIGGRLMVVRAGFLKRPAFSGRAAPCVGGSAPACKGDGEASLGSFATINAHALRDVQFVAPSQSSQKDKGLGKQTNMSISFHTGTRRGTRETYL